MEPKIEIKKLHPRETGEFIELVEIFKNAFEMENFMLPHQSHLQQLLERPDFVTIVAIYNGSVVGGLTAYMLEQYYATPPLAYLYDLAVQPGFQQKGIGRQLIESLKTHCKKAGVFEIFVQAHKADAQGIDFYRATGATEQDVLHFTYQLQ